MKKTIIYSILICFVFLQLTGCASMSSSGKGAALGSAVGGILGATFGGRGGAVIGAAAGAMIGAVFGDQYDKQVAERGAAARRYAYDFREERIEVEGAAVIPIRAEREANIEAQLQYTVLAPDARRLVRISESRALVVGNEHYLLSKREVLRKQGTYISAVRFTVPRDLPSGNYTLVTTISNGKQVKTAAVPLRVT